jgi:hypothetical protein
MAKFSTRLSRKVPNPGDSSGKAGIAPDRDVIQQNGILGGYEVLKRLLELAFHFPPRLRRHRPQWQNNASFTCISVH